MKLLGIVVCVCLIGASFSAQLSSVLTPTEGKKLLEHFKAPFQDLESAYYGITSLKAYTQGGAIGQAEQQSACKLVKEVDAKSLSSIFFAASTLSKLGTSCKFQLPKEAVDFAKSKINEGSDTKTIYYAVSALRCLGKPVDNDEVIGALLSAVKNENSVLSASFALLAASKLDKPKLASLLKSVDVEDMAAQADEVDERYLHFENDLQTTSNFLSAVFALSDLQKSPLGISTDQSLLFANFLLKSKSVARSSKQAALVIIPLSQMAASSQVSAAKAQLVSSNSVSEDSPYLEVSVLNVLGQPMPKLSVKIDSVVRGSDNEVVLSNVPFQFDAQRAVYKVLFWKDKPASGFYDVTLGITSPSKNLVGVSDLEYRVKVTTKIAIVDIQLGTGEKDHAGSDLKSVTYPKQADALKADTQQRIVMKFQVKDVNAGTPMLPHQVFVRFVHETSGQEVIFVAEPDKSSTYKFEVELASAGSDQFASISGKYSMSLIVGDAAISNPVFWQFGSVTLKLGESTKKPKAAFEEQYAPKPEIRHVFRLPEERPPAVISQAFTVACLLPIVLLFIMWTRVGANLGNLRLAPKNLIFHLGIAGIFVLYFFFWLKLDMFTTIQYLSGVGAVTFVFGNSVLSEMAQNR